MNVIKPAMMFSSGGHGKVDTYNNVDVLVGFTFFQSKLLTFLSFNPPLLILQKLIKSRYSLFRAHFLDICDLSVYSFIELMAVYYAEIINITAYFLYFDSYPPNSIL